MLKKLVKYGNSNALVLDKALLELLNITEGSVVKIKTDGTSLIITPQTKEEHVTVTKTITPSEALQEAALQNMAKFHKNPEDVQVYMDELNAVFKRYAEAVTKLNNPEMQQKLQEVEQRFNGDRYNSEYSKAILAVRQHYAPELVEMEKEVELISKKYAADEHQYAFKNDSFSSAVTDFKKVHEKYRHVQQELAKLNENPDYIHESVLLAEKYQVTKNSPEYIQEYTQLIAKYIPEYAAYQDELKLVGESLK